MQKKSSPPKGFVTAEKTKYHAEILANRLKNRFAHLSKKFRKQHIDCFRLYDWDIKEVRAVVDWYAGHAVIAEYVRLQTTEDWLPEMAKAVAAALKIPLENVHLKERRTKTEDEPRYSKLDSKGERLQVKERNLRFWVNLNDFLDTGLYSDHRDTRLLVGEMAEGKDFLNLFAYTGAFTCAAALGGAASTTTVDRSETYLKWAQDNLELNGLNGSQHSFIQSDAFKYLAYAVRQPNRFTIAFVDPPSFFQDHRDKIYFDVNEDHPQLLEKVLKVMAPGSTVIFSTNHQAFQPRFAGLPIQDLKELTPKTIPEDFRNRQIHRCWTMTSMAV